MLTVELVAYSVKRVGQTSYRCQGRDPTSAQTSEQTIKAAGLGRGASRVRP